MYTYGLIECIINNIVVSKHLSLPEHMSSPPLLVGFVILNLYFSMQCLCARLAIALSVLHRCTSSGYLYSIFKHFFIQLAWQIMNVLSCMGIQHYHILQIHMAITNSHFPIICGCLRVLVSNTYCVVFLFCLSSSCASFSRLSICIDPSVFSKVFFIMQNNGMRHCF